MKTATSSSNLKDLSGLTFTYLTVMGRAENDKHGAAQWLCQCVSGDMITVRGASLRAGLTKSCGCMTLALRKETQQTRPRSLRQQYPAEYVTWINMWHRVRSDMVKGASICKRWKRFAAFIGDMGQKPKGTQLIRIDQRKDFNPNNCKWGTNRDIWQKSKGRGNVTYDGKTQSLKQWARDLGISEITLRGRLRRGWTIEETLETPVKPMGRHKAIVV